MSAGVPIIFFDTHAHLGDPRFDADRETVLERARAKNVARIVEIADAPAEWERAAVLSRAHPEQLRCALGLHPYHADQWTTELPKELHRHSQKPEVVAVGEIGLDYAKCPLPPDTQKRALNGMLAAARTAELPVVLHCREAYADMLPLLRDFYKHARTTGRFHGVAHCFSGSREDALELVRLGFALGVDGPITYPKNEALRASIRAAGLAHLVLETDSPYLPPQSARGLRNEPTAVVEIAEKLATLFSAPVEEVARATNENARALFAWG